MTTDVPESRFQADLVPYLKQADLDHVELVAGPNELRLRIDVVNAGQLFYWVTFVATDDMTFAQAFAAKAAMRSFPWTMPFRPKLERAQAALPVLCRWQRAYAQDTANLCATLLEKHFEVSLESVRVLSTSADRPKAAFSEPPASAAKSQKVWLGAITAWYMQSKA
ncbi:hypothetical protein LWF15_35540 [Kineosporia rhizophila]|uniref:hypothetical protein n=1 Tax=Kineosporia rhizophila TaxID=84633 RepID=UPI000B05F545|nr:hypothetical protein [Kineosporia rhizophila]MCE0540818.1 hypothetical protein [Kineosporia rhizophila]